MDYLTTRTSLSPILRGFAPGFVNYIKGCTRLTATSDKVYQLLALGRWFSLGTPASSTTKTGRHDIAEILLKVALNTKNKSITCISSVYTYQLCICLKLFSCKLSEKFNTQNYYHLIKMLNKFKYQDHKLCHL